MSGSRNTTTANGKLIARLRSRLQWTQIDLARRAGYSERLIGKAEAGESVSVTTLDDIRVAFHESGESVSLDDLRHDPVDRARQFIWGMYIHKGKVIDEFEAFISPEVVIEMNGDPSVFPFAGRHVGIDAARAAFAAFYSVLQPPEDHSEFDSFEFLSTGSGALVWGDTWAHPIGRPMPAPVKLAIRMDFKDGKLIHFDDCFDTQMGFDHFRRAAITGENDG